MASNPPPAASARINIGFRFERLGLVSLAWPKTVTTIVVLLTLASVYGLTQLRFNENLGAALDINSERFQNLRAFSNRYGVAENDILLVGHADSLADPRTFRAMQAVIREAGSLNGVRQVTSAFSLREAAAGQVGARILPDDPPPERLAERLTAAATHPLSQGKYISEDLTTTAIILALDSSLRIERGYRGLMADIDQYLKPLAAEGGLSLAVTGNPPLRVTVVDFLIFDQLVNNIVGFLIGCVVSLLLLRSIPNAIHNVMPAGIALIWVLGGMSLMGIAITAMTIVLPVLILALAFSDSMHMTFDWQRRLAAGAAAGNATRETIAAIGPACALTSITTTVAFASLLISDAPPIFELGLAGALSTMIAFVSVIIINPLICHWRVGHAAAAPKTQHFTGGVFRGARRIARLPLAFSRQISWLSLLMAVVALVLFFSLQRSYTFLENVPQHTESYQALDLLQRQLGGFEAVQVPIRTTTGSFVDQRNFRGLNDIHQATRVLFPDADVYSLITMAEWLFPAELPISSKPVELALAAIDDRLARRWLSEDGTEAVLTVFLADTSALAIRRQVDLFSTSLQTTAADLGLIVGQPTGILAVSAYEAVGVINRLILSLALAVCACIVIIGIATRSWQNMVVSIIPNILPIVLTGSGLYFAGLGLQFTSAIAFTVAFGIAVDNTIHFLNQFDAARRRFSQTDRATIRTLQIVGPVIVATTVTLSSGMAITLFGNLPTVALFGLLCVTIFIIALISDLIILPAMLMTFFRRNH